MKTTAADQFEVVKRKSLSGAASYFIRTLLLQAVGLTAAAILSALLSPADFGIYGIVTQIIGILVFFSDIGLAAALVQKKDEPSLADYRTAFTIQQLLSWAIVAICVLLAVLPGVQSKIGMGGVWVLVALAASFPLASLKTIPSILLERRLDFQKLVVPQIVEQLVFNAVVIYCAWKGLGVTSYAYAVIARSISGVIALYMIQPWQIGIGIAKDSLHSLLGFGVKFQLNDLLARIKDQLFFIVLGYFLVPLTQFGYIQWAKTWSLYPYTLTVQNVMAITFPSFSRLQDNVGFLKRAIEKSLFFISLLVFPMIVGMSVLISPVLELVPRYGQWQPAVASFVLFTLSIGWSAISTPLTNTLNAIGKIDITLRLMLLWTALTWILTPLCLYFFGFTGVAVAALLISCTSFLPVRYVQRFVPIRVWEQVWRQLVASISMGVAAVVGVQLLPTSWLSLIAVILLSGGVYLLTLTIIGAQKMKEELQPLFRLAVAKIK